MNTEKHNLVNRMMNKRQYERRYGARFDLWTIGRKWTKYVQSYAKRHGLHLRVDAMRDYTQGGLYCATVNLSPEAGKTGRVLQRSAMTVPQSQRHGAAMQRDIQSLQLNWAIAA